MADTDLIQGAEATYGSGITQVAGLLLGDTNQGISFDGTANSWVEVSDLYDFSGNAPFTLICLIRPGNQRVFDFPALISKKGSDGAGGQGWDFFLDSFNTDGLSIRLAGARNLNGVEQKCIGATTLSRSGTTYHCAMTYDGTSIRLYLNGVLDGGPTGSAASMVNTTIPITLGNEPVGHSWRYYVGVMDEVSIYDIALSAGSIADDYQASISRAVSVLAGTLLSSGVEFKSIALPARTGALTPTGALTRTWSRRLLGALTPSGLLTKSPLKRLTGALASAGSLATVRVRLVARSGALAPTGGLVKQILERRTGTLAPSGILLIQSSMASSAVAGVLATSGAVRKSVSKLIGGALTPAGGLIRRLSRSFGGTLASAGAYARTSGSATAFSGALAPVGAISKTVVLRKFIGTLTTSGIGRAIPTIPISLIVTVLAGPVHVAKMAARPVYRAALAARAVYRALAGH